MVISVIEEDEHKRPLFDRSPRPPGDLGPIWRYQPPPVPGLREAFAALWRPIAGDVLAAFVGYSAAVILAKLLGAKGPAPPMPGEE
jgi:hypothetical protein